MNTKITAIAVIVVIVVAVAAIYVVTSDDSSKNEEKEGETVTVTDVAGNEVTLTLPVERVALTSTEVVDVFAAAVGEGWEDYVCMMPADMDGSGSAQSREPEKAKVIYDMYPELNELPKCPDTYLALMTGTFPTEEIVDAEPDLVLVPGSTMGYFPDVTEGVVEALGKAGIAVLYIDFYNGTFSETDAASNLDPLGTVMGVKDRTDRIVEWYNDAIEEVTSIIDTLPESEKGKKVYYEVTMGDGTTYGRIVGMGTPDVTAVGAVNILEGVAGGVTMDWDADKMMAANPDVIVIACSAYFGSEQYFGYGAEPTEAQLEAMAAPYLDRDIWDEITAVKNGAVQFRYGELRNTPLGIYDLYATAKLVYPDQFEDLDPEAVAEEFYDLFMPWSFDGTWSYNPL